MTSSAIKDMKSSQGILSPFREDDFIPESEYEGFGIGCKDVPRGFKVWRHCTPPVRNYLNIYGGNVYGISLMEMVMQGVDEDAMSLLDSNDTGKFNAFYQEKGIYIVRSTTGREYYLVPKSIEAGLRKDIADGIERVSAAIENSLKENADLERPFRIGAFKATNDLIFNVLQFRFPDLEFVKIDPEQVNPGKKFDFIYITSGILDAGNQRLKKENKNSTESLLKRFVSSLICLAFKLLEENGVLFILHNRWVYHPKDSVRIKFRKNEEDELKKILVFSYLFGSSYHLHGNTVELSRHSFVTYLQYPFLQLEQDKKELPFKKDIKAISVEEISSFHPDNASYSQRVFRFDHLPVLNRLFRVVHSEVFIPDYLKEIIQQRFRLKETDFFTTWISIFKKQESISLAEIEEPLVEQHLSGAPLSLTAEYKNTFRYVIEVLNIIKGILQFELYRSKEEMRTVQSFPFKLHEDEQPIGQIMKLQSLYSGDNPYFTLTTILLTKIDLLEELKRIIAPHRETIPILENFDILNLMGFSAKELQEICQIVTDHGPITRIIFGKYPLRSMEVLTNKIHREGYSYHRTKHLLECFIFHSIAEALAANNRQLSQAQWDRFFEVLERAEKVVFDLKGCIDWEVLQKEDIDKADGTLKMVALIILRIFKMEFAVQLIVNLQNRTGEELFIDAGYEPEVFRRLNEVKDLILYMERFKTYNYPQNDFSKPYFFRDFLDCEFHGTGRTIAKLGLVRGFKLLLMSVIPAESHKINFNPIPTDEVLIGKIKRSLDRLGERELTLEYLEGVKKELREKKICYIYDTGFQLKAIPETHTLEVHYEDIDENINKMLKLLKMVEKKKIYKIKVEVLREIENLFRTIESYPEVYNQEIRRLKNGVRKKHNPQNSSAVADPCSIKKKEIAGLDKKIAHLEKKNQDICMIRDKVRSFFSHGIFQPTEIYTNLRLLFSYCPNILNFTLHEIEEYRQIEIKRKEHTEPATNYILRCMNKFQAIAVGNLDDFQNLEVFSNLCRKEFRDITRQTIGLNSTQLKLLEEIYKKLPADYQEALMIALVFQDVGKIPQNIGRYRTSIDFSDHGRAGAKVLEEEKSLLKLETGPQVIKKSLFLIYHHGLIGQIIRGEDPYDVLKPVTDMRDKNILNAFFLHCIVAAAAFREDLMSYDLFEKFLAIYRIALQVLKEAEMTWENVYRGMGQKLSWEVKAVREPMLSMDKEKNEDHSSPKLLSPTWTPGDEAMAMHRLLKLLGVGDIRYTEVLRAEVNSELNWMYFYKRERTFRSLGPRSFNQQFNNAQYIYGQFKRLSPHLKEKIIFYLSGKGGTVRFLALGRTVERVSRENRLKFILWILLALEYQKKQSCRPSHDLPYLDLYRLSNVVDDRKTVINKELDKITLLDFDSRSWIESFLHKKRGLLFKIDPLYGTIQFFFIDPVDISRDIREMKKIVNINELNLFYRRRLLLLSNDPSVFKDQIKLFSRHHKSWLGEIKLLAVKRMQYRMEHIAGEIMAERNDFNQLKKVYEKTMAAKIFEDQHLRLLRDKYEYTMGRLRDEMVQNMIGSIHDAKSISALEKCYIEVINFMKSHQPFFQRELQKHLLNQYLRRKSFFKKPKR